MPVASHKCQPTALLRINGEDVLDYLQSQLSIDLSRLEINHVRYGLRLNIKGKTLAGMYVIKESEDQFLILSRKTPANYLIQLLEENIVADDVEISDKSQDFLLLTAKKENATAILRNLKLDLPSDHKISRNQDHICFLDSRLAHPTYSIILPSSELNFISKITQFIEWNTFEQERISSGLIAVPEEIGPGELPQEGKLHLQHVDFEKGCYLGQEVMARIHAMGNIRRKSLVVQTDNLLKGEFPYPLLLEGKEVGLLKSLIAKDKQILGIAIIHEKALTDLKTSGLIIKGTDAKIRLYE